MRKSVCVLCVVFIGVFLLYGCNIVPKSVQYQKEETDLVGNVEQINPVIEEIQVVLTSLGCDTGNKEGKMSQKTRDAIKEFQESRGIKPTGYIDDLTLRQIEDIRRAEEQKELEKSYSVDVRSAFPEKGASGVEAKWTVKDIQNALKNAGFDPGTIDGKLGPRTQQAVKEFQRTKGLKVDGKVGPQTWGELNKYLKK